jgi:hypothetical protein
MTRRIALITTLLALVLATPAAAQQSPFGPLPQPAPTETPAPVATATPSGDNSTGRATLFLIGGVLVIGFLAIGWFIMRDARGAIPEDKLAALGRARDEGPHAHKRQAKARARARTRRQREARKKNRK